MGTPSASLCPAGGVWACLGLNTHSSHPIDEIVGIVGLSSIAAISISRIHDANAKGFHKATEGGCGNQRDVVVENFVVVCEETVVQDIGTGDSNKVVKRSLFMVVGLVDSLLVLVHRTFHLGAL